MDRPFGGLPALFFAIATQTATVPASAEPVAPSAIRVVDGDTIALLGAGPTVRLVGLDAPERTHPRCPAEADLAAAASARLAELIREAPLDLERVACACRSGTQGTPACNHGRACGILRSRDRDVGAVLIAEGLAVPYRCGATRCPRREARWCAGAEAGR